jgi:hypothetical protein
MTSTVFMTFDPSHVTICFATMHSRYQFYQFLIPLLPPLKHNDFIYELASNHIVIKTAKNKYHSIVIRLVSDFFFSRKKAHF